MTSALIIVLFLIAVPWVGVGVLGLNLLFGIILPYAAFGLFVAGFLRRLLWWGSSPVPFHIPTVCGQQKSLAWIKADGLESPSTFRAVVARMALDVLVFRSLWRDDRAELKQPVKLIYSSKRFLWLGAILFHWSLLVVLLRHLRLFTQPMLPGISALQELDGFFQIGIPALYVSDIMVCLGLVYLLFRRIFFRQVRLISLVSDYFALFLLISVVASGILMRHFFKVDLEHVKELSLAMIGLRPALPAGPGQAFYVHLFLVCVLFAYFPWSKLMHAPGILLSPTRNLRNDSRLRRYVNPWAYPVKVHTYEEYEDDFRSAMQEAGIPVEKG